MILLKIKIWIDFLLVIQEKDTFIPSTAKITGDCSGDDQQTFILRWKTFVLKFYFSKVNIIFGSFIIINNLKKNYQKLFFKLLFDKDFIKIMMQKL